MLRYEEHARMLAEAKKPKGDRLSGAVVVLDGKVLLVNPRKFQHQHGKWSVPKGHVEKKLDDLRNALKELQEESGIHLAASMAEELPEVLSYEKSGVRKELRCFLFRIQRGDVPFRLYNDMILRRFLDLTEVAEAGFFSRQDAASLVEPYQLPLLKHVQ